jgi:hypothetical protein
MEKKITFKASKEKKKPLSQNSVTLSFKSEREVKTFSGKQN